MSDIIIKAENLGKKYTIGHQAENGRYVALRDVLMQNARTLLHKTRDLAQGKAIIQGDILEEVWALKDLNFEIHRGEAVGIIGRNGAGKSTLLKILSRITEPSAGRVTIQGRIASLLEVGTGFHPELTGRENIYLNGAILGMTRLEIKRQFDEIVAFAEVEKFLDTPVKRYSSGMYVRLAFAVAAHMEPEILLVDEVLAVGDSAFQKKCLGKMKDVGRKGRTVLFVSHNMGAISTLCDSCIWISSGSIRQMGDVTSVVDSYVRSDSNTEASSVDLTKYPRNAGTGEVKFTRVALRNSKGLLTTGFQMGESLNIECELESKQTVKHARLSVHVKTISGIPVFHLLDQDDKFTLEKINSTRRVRITINNLSLYPGIYSISLWAGDIAYQCYDYILDCISFTVLQSSMLGRTEPLTLDKGLLLQPSEWREI